MTAASHRRIQTRKPARPPVVDASEPWPRRPTRDELARAVQRRVPDLIAPALGVLFVGINPGLYSAATGHHFARPGNRFWPTLHRAGFTPRPFRPWEGRDLLALGYGITNLVSRPSVAADELTANELAAGGRRLVAKVRRYRPAWVAFVGITAYRTAFARPRATIGEQEERTAGARTWVLPNPSGLNAHHRPADLAALFRALREAVDHTDPPRDSVLSR